MNILLISSSPRKNESNTFLLAREVLKVFPSSAHTKIIHLCDFKIDFCRHCENCHKKILCCPIKDDVRVISGEILEADGIIFASPNYIDQVTASMKSVWERLSHFIHCKRLLGKYVIGVVSSGSGEDSDVLDYIRHYAYTCAAQYSGGLSSRVPISKDKIEEAVKLGNKLMQDIQEKKIYPEQIKIIDRFKENFKRVMEKRKDEWNEEYQYWQDKDWL